MLTSLLQHLGKFYVFCVINIVVSLSPSYQIHGSKYQFICIAIPLTNINIDKNNILRLFRLKHYCALGIVNV